MDSSSSIVERADYIHTEITMARTTICPCCGETAPLNDADCRSCVNCNRRYHRLCLRTKQITFSCGDCESMAEKETKRHDDELTERLRTLYRPTIIRAGGSAYAVRAGEPLIALDRVENPIDQNRRKTSYMKMKENLQKANRKVDKLSGKLEKISSENKSLTRQIGKLDRKNGTLTEEVARLKQRLRAAKKDTCGQRCKAVPNYEEHNRLLSKRNLIRPRQPPATVTSAISASDNNETDVAHESLNDELPSLFGLEPLQMDDQMPTFESEVLNDQQILDFYVVEGEEATMLLNE